MKIEEVRLKNFKCFGPEWVTISLEPQITTFIGNNGSGKTACFQALSRLFGIASGQRGVRRRDFHVPVKSKKLESGATLEIEVKFGFPEIAGNVQNPNFQAIPELFTQMSISEPTMPVKAKMRLYAEWTDNGTQDGDITEELRWITDEDLEWEKQQIVQPAERGYIQFIYVPSARDAASQVTNLLRGRLWKAAKWSENFKQQSSQNAENIQSLFEDEFPVKLIAEKLKLRWDQLNEADTDRNSKLRLVNKQFEELIGKVEFVFEPDEFGRERELDELSDGQKSLFHIALTSTTLEVEKDAFNNASGNKNFEQEKLKQTYLTILAVEELENNLSPFFLSRIVNQTREIGALSTAQVLLSSHSPAILGRIEPTEVRHFRLSNCERVSKVNKISLPENNEDASRYVRLAVKAYPEIYFARFVVLGEGETERLVLPKLAEAMGVNLDPSFVPVVPIGGRYVKHFWKLLNDLGIEFATLLDLDLGRRHGGTKLIKEVANLLKEFGRPLMQYFWYRAIDKDCNRDSKYEENLSTLTDEEVKMGNCAQVSLFQHENVFFSFPIDIDFAMLSAFPQEYQKIIENDRGPDNSESAIQRKKDITLKAGGNPSLFDESYNESFTWYPYLFLNRSKPETHIKALSQIDTDLLRDSAPKELISLIKSIEKEIQNEGEKNEFC